MANQMLSALQQAMGAMDRYVTKPMVNAGVQAVRGAQNLKSMIQDAQNRAYQNYWSQRPHEMISPLASPTPNPTDQRMQQQGYTKNADGSYSRKDPRTGFTSTIRFGKPSASPSASPLAKAQQRWGTPGINPNASDTVTEGLTPGDVQNVVQNVAGMFGRNPSTNKVSISPEVSSAIQMASQQYGVPAALLYDIAMQESSLNPNARNGQEGVTAAGLFQINNPTWDTINRYGSMPGNTLKQVSQDRMDPRNQALATAYLIKNGQLGRWDASKNVWGQFWPQQELENQGFYSQTMR